MNLNSSNRLVRTRMLGGVAGAEPNGSPLCRFGASPEHAGCGAILRVPTPSGTLGGIDPQISYSAFSSHETSSNPHAVAHAERLSRQ